MFGARTQLKGQNCRLARAIERFVSGVVNANRDEATLLAGAIKHDIAIRAEKGLAPIGKVPDNVTTALLLRHVISVFLTNDVLNTIQVSTDKAINQYMWTTVREMLDGEGSAVRATSAAFFFVLT